MTHLAASSTASLVREAALATSWEELYVYAPSLLKYAIVATLPDHGDLWSLLALKDIDDRLLIKGK